MYSAGAHVEFEVLGHPIETGLDWHAFDQTLIPYPRIADRRHIRFSQLRVPLTYNLDLFRDRSGNPSIGLRLGLSGAYTALLDVEDRPAGNNYFPAYTFTRFDVGPQLGLTLFPPLRFCGLAPGLFVELYRGTVIYQDELPSAKDCGNHSWIRAGLTVRALER
jgi:hypothetical protein